MSDGPCRLKVHDVSVLAAASLVRAAVTDGPCRLKVHDVSVLSDLGVGRPIPSCVSTGLAVPTASYIGQRE